MRRRGDAWELRVFVGLEPCTGKKCYATKTVRGGKREAQRALAEMVTRAAEGRLALNRGTVRDLLEEFAHASPDFSPKTPHASTTLNVYSHFLQSADRDAADVLGLACRGTTRRSRHLITSSLLQPKCTTATNFDGRPARSR